MGEGSCEPRWKRMKREREAGWEWVGTHHFSGGHPLVSSPKDVVLLSEANARLAAAASELTTLRERAERAEAEQAAQLARYGELSVTASKLATRAERAERERDELREAALEALALLQEGRFAKPDVFAARAELDGVLYPEAP